MTKPELLEFLSECVKRGVVVTLNMNVVMEPERRTVPVDDGSPAAPPEVPDLLSYYYGKR